MKIFIAPLVIGTLALAGASPAAAQSKPATDQGVSVGVATTRNSTAERTSYKQTAQDETRIWQQKLDDLDAKTKVKATEAQTSASKDLDDAWTPNQDGVRSAGDGRRSGLGQRQSLLPDRFPQTCSGLEEAQSRGQVGEVTKSTRRPLHVTSRQLVPHSDFAYGRDRPIAC